ncbi:MAG: pyruvate kinase [Phycisphaerae bacterium]|nr:pyruvate kinase [Phycisphaerae bacterium]
MSVPRVTPPPRTKLVATIGPASSSEETLSALLSAGVDVCRLNFSHGTLAEHAQVLAQIRAWSAQHDRPVAVLGDLCGPKIRLNRVAGGPTEINVGARVEIVRGDADGTAERLTTNYPPLIDEVQPGQRIYINDGLVRLLVVERSPERLVCACLAGGAISDRKGVNLPDTRLSVPALTDKDRADLDWAIRHELDFVALSFVRRAADVDELRSLVGRHAGGPSVVVKIETAEALENLDEIILRSDAVMAARGDLGVEMDVWQVPAVQKRLTARCREMGRPIIIATQMLQAMVDSPSPTRAEVSDVANAILDKADAIMLSAETSVGEFPVDAVNMMVRIAVETEGYVALQLRADQDEATDAVSRVATAVAHGASLLARQLDARLVAVWTQSGNTARLLSKTRMPAPIIGLSPNDFVCRRMALFYGVTPVCLKREERILAMLRDVDDALIAQRLARPGDLAIVIAGTHLNDVGATNALLIHLVSTADQGLPRFTG